MLAQRRRRWPAINRCRVSVCVCRDALTRNIRWEVQRIVVTSVYTGTPMYKTRRLVHILKNIRCRIIWRVFFLRETHIYVKKNIFYVIIKHCRIQQYLICCTPITRSWNKDVVFNLVWPALQMVIHTLNLHWANIRSKICQRLN